MTEPLHLPVRQGYDAWSEVYDTDGNPLVLLEDPVVRGWLGQVEGRRIVDVGCGTGRHTQWLAQAGAEVVALDCSLGMMSRARAKVAGGRVLFCRHSLPDPLPLADASCDHVLFALVGEHVEHPRAVLVEFARILRPGGTVVFTALHPAMNLRGLTARFFEPGTGREVRVAAYQ
ncbi:MAG: class I SAM-dependent methyltransferase, partial [Planctomycetes bacterium]|nr:class I SAM-dependent methyltransferase [Planctomycetota bacterium]